jgi:hypothetical protein
MMSATKNSSLSHPYFDQTIVLTTKHEKLSLIGPILESELNLNVALHEADTDQLGTFTGEVERTLSPRDAAIEKAKLGMRALGSSLGVASEGSIGPDPLLPFTRSNIEYIALVDTNLGVEILERYRSLKIIAGDLVTEPSSDISNFLAEVDFPNHKLIAQPNNSRGQGAIKGIGAFDQLEGAIAKLSALSLDGKVHLQSDHRSHCSPSRQYNIIQAARLLAERIKALCPSCSCPGFGEKRYERGLDCLECGELVSGAVKFEISGCVKCSFEEKGPQLAQSADPSSCNGCNP